MIPVFTLARQNKNLDGEIKKAIDDVVKSGNFILGEKVSEFEKAFASYIGAKFAVGVASGTDALSLALLSFGVAPGDEVILPANVYPSVFAVAAIGAVPKLVDIDPETYNINPAKIATCITKRTKAIIAVHLYGNPADMGRIMEIGKKYKIPVIEDCAQAHGAGYKFKVQSSLPALACASRQAGKFKVQKVGSIGDAGCFSFYPTKNLGCFGDGGMVVTNDKETAEKIRLLRMYGERKRYDSILPGRNSRLDELQAAILLVKLKYLDEWNKKRREIAKLYKSEFHRGRTSPSEIRPPQEISFTKHIYHLFVIRTNRRDELKDYLEKKGIKTAVHYPTPIHLQPSFAYLGYKKGDFPESEKACREVLSLPMFPELEEREVEEIIKRIVEFIHKS